MAEFEKEKDAIMSSLDDLGQIVFDYQNKEKILADCLLRIVETILEDSSINIDVSIDLFEKTLHQDLMEVKILFRSRDSSSCGPVLWLAVFTRFAEVLGLGNMKIVPENNALALYIPCLSLSYAVGGATSLWDRTEV